MMVNDIIVFYSTMTSEGILSIVEQAFIYGD